MNTEVPPLPNAPAATSIHHKAGTYAVLAFPLSIALSMLTAVAGRAAAESGPGILQFMVVTIPALVMFSSIPAGIIALCGIPKYGKRKLLWKGLFGVLVPVLLTVLALP